MCADDPKNDALYGPTTLCNPPPAAKITQNDKCGYGPRIPVLVVSPYAKLNFVDHTPTDFTSILKFIEDNWNLGQIGSGSLDTKANSLDSMFDFRSPPHTAPLILNPSTGQKS
jgi:phospholipase C